MAVLLRRMSEVVSTTSTGRSAGIAFCMDSMFFVQQYTIADARYKYGTIAEVKAGIIRKQVHAALLLLRSMSRIMSEVVSSTWTGRTTGIAFCMDLKFCVEYHTIVDACYKDGTIADENAVIVRRKVQALLLLRSMSRIMSQVVSWTSTRRTTGSIMSVVSKIFVKHYTIAAARYNYDSIDKVNAVII